MAHRFARRRERPETPPAAQTDAPDGRRLAMLQWHLDRYDRLRLSTVTRASVVLSAGAILSAGNAVLLGQASASPAAVLGRGEWRLGIAAATVITSLLVVSSIITASGVLLTGRRSRDAFPGARDIPVGLIFNSSDTIDEIADFAGFRTATRQSVREMADAAEVDLWICLHQHRYRYRRLRRAVRLLRWAGVAFALLLVAVLTAQLVSAPAMQ